MSTWPQDRTTMVTWRADPQSPPQMCTCGHLHYGWLNNFSNLAPQWGYCGECGCTVLRRVPE